MIPDTVIRVLELAEQYALAAEVPLELKDALDYCIGKQWVKIQPVCALLDRERLPSATSAGSNFAPYRRSPLVLPGTNQHPRRLLLESEGRATLAERRLQSTGEPLRNVEQASTGEALGQAIPKQKSTKPKPTTVNECMAVLLLGDPTRMGWSATKWAEAVSDRLKRKVTDAACKQTDTWKKQIIPGRLLMKADKASRSR